MIKQDQLWAKGPHFYYDTALFPPTTDSFALGYFARPRRGGAVCDLGSGIGLLGALLLSREPSLHIVNVEQNADAFALAERTFAENGWAAEQRLGDLRDASVLPAAGSMDYCVCNPPYFRSGSGRSAEGEARQNAREEAQCTLAEVCAAKGVSALFVSHDIAVVRSVCRRAIVMRGGRMIERGSTEEIIAQPGEEYTKQLIASVML